VITGIVSGGAQLTEVDATDPAARLVSAIIYGSTIETATTVPLPGDVT
jgi:hypothetical protein